jgi:transposase-like protein
VESLKSLSFEAFLFDLHSSSELKFSNTIVAMNRSYIGEFRVAKQKLPRVPPTVNGIQANFCKNPKCSNFSIPVENKKKRILGAKTTETYRIIGGQKLKRLLTCLVCRKSYILRSNLAISQELSRLDHQKHRERIAACCNEACECFGKPQYLNPELYFAHGVTKAGTARYRCRNCKATFSVGLQVRNQRRPELNSEVLKLLVNKVPMRRICEILSINPSTLYDKIKYLYEVTSLFISERESHLRTQEPSLKRAYVSVDRQDHTLNWGTQFDRRNTILGAVGAVENKTGYVLVLQLNFDPDLNAEDVEADAIAIGDYEKSPVFREYARVWLRRDYLDPELRDDDVAIETEVQNIEAHDASKAPQSGMKVDLGYLQNAIFLHLRDLLQNVGIVRFCVDRDPGLANACIAAFADQIKKRKADVFVLKNLKEATMAAKKQIIAASNREIDKEKLKFDNVDNPRFRLLVEKLNNFRNSSQENTWFKYPFSDMAEPSKSIQNLTDFGDYDIERLAHIYMHLTMRGIDRYFMQIRRRLSLMERPITTANAKKTWHGYSAYSPLVAMQVLSIFRVYYNYSLAGEDKKTPAMRIGLADRIIPLEELSILADRG